MVRFMTVAAGAFVLLGLCAAEAQQAAAPASPRQGYLLLRNGNLLHGETVATQDGFSIRVDGGEIHVRSDQVLFFCSTLEEGYLQRKTLVREGDLQGHLELAQWCQRLGLLGQAAEQLAEARALNPGHPLIPLIERRIKMSLCPVESPEASREPSESSPSSDELDRLVRQMPYGTVETFTQTIQPLLINRCSTAGCHGPDTETAFRLLRTPPSRPASRRVTQRNLYSALGWIDREAPGASRLLTAPGQGEGTAHGAVFGEHERFQYQRLVNWVHQVASAYPEVPSIATADKAARSPQGGEPRALEAASGQVRQASYDAPVEASAPERPPRAPSRFVPGQSLPVEPTRPAQGAPGEPPRVGGRDPADSEFDPIDPFDPAIFNRRYHREVRR